MSQAVVIESAAHGVQNEYIDVDPQYTPFRGGYYRHSRFVREYQTVQFQATGDYAREFEAEIPKAGDMVGEVFLVAVRKVLQRDQWYVNEFGHALIDNVIFKMGPNEMDKHDAEYYHIVNTCMRTEDKQLYDTIGRHKTMADLKAASQMPDPERPDYCKPLYVPFQFYFNRHVQQHFPIVAQGNHKMKFTVKTKDWRDLVAGKNITKPDIQLYLLVEYFGFLDEEREVWVNNPHTYLYEQAKTVMTHAVGKTTTASKELTMSHPYHELFWLFQPAEFRGRQEVTDENGDIWNYPPLHFCYAALESNPADNQLIIREPLKAARFYLNGYERHREMDAIFWREMSFRDYHSAIPRFKEMIVPFYGASHTHTGNLQHGFYRVDGGAMVFDAEPIDVCQLQDNTQALYAWIMALKPEAWRPTGSINFAMIPETKIWARYHQLGKGEGIEDGGEMRVVGRYRNVFKLENGVVYKYYN